MSSDDSDGPWVVPDPWTVMLPRQAMTDCYSEAVVDEAVGTLTLLRAPMHLGDALAELHALVSLLTQIHARLPVVVAEAKDQGHSWAGIADQLGVTSATAQRRYGHRITTDQKRK